MTQRPPNVNIDCEPIYAHIDGHTEFDYIPGKNKVVTVGIEGEIRVWSLDDFQVQECYNDDGDAIYSVIAADDRVFIASASNCAKSFDLPELDNEQSVCKFTANATALHSVQQKLLAVGAADMTIKLVSLQDRSLVDKIFESHTAPILSLALDPQMKYLASSACDGTICMWSIESKAVLHTWRSVFPRSNDFENSTTLARIAWRPETGELFALPSKTSIELYKRGDWDKPTTTVNHDSLTKGNPDTLLSIIAFSVDGSLLGVATTNSMIFIWKMSDVLASSANKAAPIATFYGFNDQPFTCFKFSTINPLQFGCADKAGTLTIATITAPGLFSKKPASAAAALNADDIMDLLDDDFEDDMDFFMASQESKKTKTTVQEKTATASNKTFVSTTKTKIEEIVSLTMSKEQQVQAASVPEKASTKSLEDELDDDFNAEFDIGAIKSQYESLIFGEDDESKQGTSKSGASSFKAGSTAVTALSGELTIDGHRVKSSDLLALIRQQTPRHTTNNRQAAFQSGSTPIHYKRRFMVWNSVGIVYGHNTEEERSIDVEFHDVAYHHSIHMVNHLNYTIADLSTACLVLGSNGDDESEDELEHTKARLFVQMFNSFDAVKEWQVEFARDEAIEAVTASTTFVAVATSLQYLRVWTVGGIQTTIVSLNGAAVNLSSYERFLMVLAHQGPNSLSLASGNDQSIAVQVLKVDHKGKTRAHPVPTPVPLALSPKSTAVWAGFTDEGTPAVMDSDGVVRLYKSHFGSGWFPVCATKEHGNGRSDNFFVIGMSEIQAQIRCIFCKASRYPDTVPKPTLTILPLQVPLCELYTNKAKHEEEAIRSRWLGSLLKRLSTDGYDVDTALEDADKRVINSLIKLFALALGAERQALALEIAKLMPNRSALEGAVRYAERQQHRTLAMKLIEMMKDEDADADSDEDEVNSDTELAELMVRKGADQARQLLSVEAEEESQSSSSRMVALSKFGSDSVSNSGFVQLKPKPMGARGGQSSMSVQSTPNVEDDEMDGEVVAIEDDDDNANDGCLRPKRMDHLLVSNKENAKNPFKVTEKAKKSTNQRMRESALKRKQYEVEDEEEVIDLDDQSNGAQEEEEDNEAFKRYYESNRDTLLEDNMDAVEEEADLIQVAKTNYAKLSEGEKKKWQKLAAKQAAKKSAKRSKQAEKKAAAEAQAPKVNKITNFFGRSN